MHLLCNTVSGSCADDAVLHALGTYCTRLAVLAVQRCARVGVLGVAALAPALVSAPPPLAPLAPLAPRDDSLALAVRRRVHRETGTPELLGNEAQHKPDIAASSVLSQVSAS